MRSVLALALTAVVSAAAAADGPDAVLQQGQQLMGRGQYREALALLDPLTSLTGLTPLQHARLYQELSAARSQTGPDVRALADADEAERSARTLGAWDLLARIESVRGVVWLNRGRNVESLRHFRECVTYAERSAQPPLIAGAYIRLAAAYQDLGDFARALDAVNHSGEADPHPADAARVQFLARRGLLLAELHDETAGRASVLEALSIARRLGDKRSQSQLLIDLALVSQRADGPPAEAIGYAAQAVALARDIQVPSLEIPALSQLGGLLRVDGQLEMARQRLTEGLAAIRRADDHRDEAYILKNLGQVATALGHRVEGERLVRAAVARADAMGLTRARWTSRLELARLHAATEPDRAAREFEETLAVLEEQRTNVTLEGFRAGALAETAAGDYPYDRYIGFLVDQGRQSEAFHVAERERARAFLETLSQSREELAASVPPGFADDENAILKRITATQAELRDSSVADERRHRLVADADADEARLTALRLRLATERPALAEARYPKFWRVDELQATQIRGDEALVAFFLGAERSLCWIITRAALTTIVLPPRAAIEARVRAALQELRDPSSTGDAALRALAGALSVDRILAAGNRPHLVIVPHGILYDVPFEALPDASGHSLLERAAVSYAPSASSLAFFRSTRPAVRPSASLLAIGDPIVHQGGRAATRQVDLAHVDLLSPLPHSAEEMRDIAALFPRSRVLRAGDATEAALRQSGIGNARILHFATHGLIDETRPERSGLVLTASPPDDGLLQVREIYGLRLNADLVTLSACQTALGRNVTGEGMIGLTRAFFFAGAHAVVASLWDIEDASTARLMRQFYANLRDGEPLDVALQHAKLALLRGAAPTSRPFFWASFIATGEGRATLPAERAAGDVRRSSLLWLALAAAAAIAAALWRMSAARRGASAGPTRPAP